MDRNQVYDTVGRAIKAASGKSFAEAQKLISEAVMGLTEAPVDKFVVGETETSAEPEIPPSVLRKPPGKITTLRPVIQPPPRSIVKEVWTAEQVQAFIDNNTPAELSFIPDGTDHEARLTRIVTVDTNKPPTIQLSYRPSNNDPEVPYPKHMLFTTDEGWDWEKILAKLAKDAAAMYRLREGPIVTHKVSTGGRVIFSNKAEV
jgi:hypothetical protein